jgi:molybdenum cofactor cytidylyltransferase
MQRPKLSIKLSNGKRIGSLALRAALASQLDHIVIVTREDDSLDWLQEVREAYDISGRCSQVICKDANLGMSHSLRCGLEAAGRQEAEAVVILLADQPFVSSIMINRLIDAFRADHYLDYAASSATASLKKKPPVLLARSLFAVIQGLDGDVGAKELLSSPLYKGKIILENANDRFCDADVWEDVEKLSRIAETLSCEVSGD